MDDIKTTGTSQLKEWIAENDGLFYSLRLSYSDI